MVSISLRQLNVIFPGGIGKKDMLVLLRRFGHRLNHLHVAVPWVPTTMPWPQQDRVLDSPLAGITNDLLDFCPRLNTLRIQDSSFRYISLPVNPNLETLEVAVHELRDYQASVVASRLQGLQALILTFPTSRNEPSRDVYRAFKEQQNKLHGGRIERFWITSSHPHTLALEAFKDLLMRLPDQVGAL